MRDHRELREIGRRFHRREIEHLEAIEIVKVPSVVEETSEGFLVTMINGAGEPVEQVRLDHEERVVARTPIAAVTGSATP
ncbi:MAG: hypothetical protein ABTQ32_19785 [Myxococcaceae bacterium]